MKRILIINDDGISSPGLTSLASELVQKGKYEVTIVAPAEEQSGVGFHVTVHTPVYAEQVVLHGDLASIPAYVIYGTPVDCVKLALRGLIPDYKPDVVLSGINKGLNLARLVPYSGTVSAALEATLNGIPSFAFSLENARTGVWNFVFAAEIAAWVVEQLLECALPPDVTINVNIPNRPAAEIQGIRFAHQGQSFFREYYVEEEPDARGRRRFRLEGGVIISDTSEDMDGYALSQGWVTVTPLACHTERCEMAGQVSNWPIFAAKFPFKK